MADETGPIIEDITVYLDTDNTWDFAILDAAGAQLNVSGWTGDLEVDRSSDFSGVKLTVPFSVVVDPLDATKYVLRVTIPQDELQPGTDPDQWPVITTHRKYPYSLKRDNLGAERVLRKGEFIVERARV